MRLLLITLLVQMTYVGLAQPVNTLSALERQEGWQLLFDGKTTAGWRGAYANTFPRQGWQVVDGELRGEHSKFNNYAGFATIAEGHILLQDHGHNVAFRNLKIKPLP
ncbi:hypothetical protein [Spirosoma montaniterrae]|uniref:3-keto-disaccharide hydrolase domain-containing protein n=1 Tax=Spirosoma montaniterrae TaxID=1178516 RepID=A0A1P9WRL4_9BACT|nr:hypothetical protein [Spirosoma montaniterrae]AQG78008.1 hypothetical protein AWR27_00760 [Spirosoma montaniterrae]